MYHQDTVCMANTSDVHQYCPHRHHVYGFDIRALSAALFSARFDILFERASASRYSR